MVRKKFRSGKKQKLEIASEKLERAISLYPDFEEAINRLARIRIWQGDFQSAESLSRKLVSIYPQNPLYLYLKAFVEEKTQTTLPKIRLKTI
ncbi:tetratricopeptide repeat protein [Leptospira interrogans serovar Bataviae str. HAI135]|nr:tetratricopeptide repeat protein [Leptospira interrogans serovar Bataviae str. HAI135]